MGKEILAEKIVFLRKSKGLSQEELAYAASINLRTLQRIETGKTEPRGQTLRLIANALDIPFESFLEISKAEEDTRFLQTLNLSSLAFWLFPLGNIIVPLILWGIKESKTPGSNQLRKRIIIFQTAWSTIIYGYVYTIIIRHETALPAGISNLQFILGLYILNSLVILIASFQISRGRERIYSLGM